MARSTYIYVVATRSELPVAVFTVKYECLDWVARSNWNLDNIDMYRYPDGAAYLKEHSFRTRATHMPWDRKDMEKRRVEFRTLESTNSNS